MRRTLFLALSLLGAASAQAAPPTVGGCQVFPADNYWNTPIDTLPLHPMSNTWVGSVGSATRLHADWGKGPPTDNYGIPYTTVTAAQPLVPILPDPFDDYSDESDPGPYPIPPNAPIEGGGLDDGDRHVLVIETTNCMLYELYHAYPQVGGAWTASSFVKWNLASNASRTNGWTSADASGMPLFQGLVRREEVLAGEINHAIRFTAVNIWAMENGQRKYLWPARHWSGSSTNSNYPPIGARFRLKASFDTVNKPGGGTYHAETQVILRAMKKYGLVLVDGGGNWFFQGVSDPSWPDQVFSDLNGPNIFGNAFEVVDTSVMMVHPDSMQALQPATDVGVSQVATPSPGSAGKDVAFAITVSNLGSGAASGVTMTATLPGASTLIWASPGCTAGAGTVTCALGTLGGGTNTPLKIVVRPTAAGSITNTANVVATGDTNAANDSAATMVTVNASPAGVPVQRYRLYSPVTLEHHFTTDLNEYNTLGTFVGTWVQEGTVGKVLNNPGQFNGVTAVPYYRLYDTSTQWHHWTTDANEYYTLGLFPWWNQEGVDGYILPTNTAGATELYRLLYPFVAGLHHWTIDNNEYTTLINSFGWIGEGGSGFVIQ